MCVFLFLVAWAKEIFSSIDLRVRCTHIDLPEYLWPTSVNRIGRSSGVDSLDLSSSAYTHDPIQTVIRNGLITNTDTLAKSIYPLQYLLMLVSTTCTSSAQGTLIYLVFLASFSLRFIFVEPFSINLNLAHSPRSVHCTDPVYWFLFACFCAKNSANKMIRHLNSSIFV